MLGLRQPDAGTVELEGRDITKLSDRGSAQTVGVVTDVGLFLHRLAEALHA